MNQQGTRLVSSLEWTDIVKAFPVVVVEIAESLVALQHPRRESRDRASESWDHQQPSAIILNPRQTSSHEGV